MSIGFPTIVIPAVKGGEGRDASKGDFILSDDQISLLSKYLFIQIMHSFQVEIS